MAVTETFFKGPPDNTDPLAKAVDATAVTQTSGQVAGREASILADAEFYGLGIDYPEKQPALIRAVTKDDVEEAARKYLTPGHCVLIVAGPALDKETLE